ncbi:MAG: DHA1 family bicyclomycin/chloramphenicol resistance-like MFS transporter, partial [Gammaproteobacteria bacterium]
PALPLSRDEFATSSNTVQNLITFYVLTLALAQLFTGTLSDRFGRKPVLMFGIGLYSISAILTLFVQSIEVLTFCRALQGIGAAACMSMGRTIINDCFERQQAAHAMSTVQTLMSVVPMLSLAAGGILAEYYGWEGSMAVMSIAGILAWALSLKLVVETNSNPSLSINLKNVIDAYSQVLRSPVYISFAMTSGLAVGSFFALNGFLPYQYQRLGVSPTEFGVWFSLTPIFYFIGNSLNRAYFVSRGIEKAILLGCGLNLISVLLLFFTQYMGMTHPLSLAIPCCLYGLSNGVIVGNSTVGAINASGTNAGTGSGLVGAWQMTVGGLAGSAIIAFGGAENFLLAAACLVAMSTAALLSIRYVYHRRAELNSI